MTRQPDTSHVRSRHRAPTPKGGFTDGVALSTVHKRAARGPAADGIRGEDAVEQEIDRAMEEGRPVNVARAFPYRPAPGNADTVPRAGRAGGDDNNPANRLDHVRRSHPQYYREYQLQLIHRLLLRGLPLDTIAEMVGMSMVAVKTARATLFKRLREEAKQTDIYGVAGQTMGFYNEVRSMAMRIATEKGSTSTRMSALRTAMQAEADKHRFLQASGFYEHNRFIPEGAREEDTGLMMGQEVMRMAMALLGDEDDMPDDVDGLTLDADGNVEDDPEDTMLLPGSGRR